MLIKDAASGVRVARLGFEPPFSPVDMEVIQSLDELGTSAITVLGRRAPEGTVWVTTLEVLTGAVLGDWTFDEIFVPVDLEVVAKRRGVPAPKVAVLGETIRRGAVRVFTHRALTGERVSVGEHGSAFRARDLEVVPRADGAKPGLAVLGERLRDGAVRVLTQSVLTGEPLGKMSFPEVSRPADLVLVRGLGGSRAGSFAVLGERSCGGEGVGVAVREVATGSSVECIPLP